ncbi:MarR family winged helix-turn-helix transcriptional regulator [Amnibacterium kyonggiense]|uniref:DNA-binding MarR family transcriptional regulator n=1 Tax=Amnibacterium kyonggiense TaxID=595671 RepID=A0A4R7FIH0_9MICO|nr:MarR family transcriptional regulator [Amnibacterium kyonggiense]TDS74460.1 DNA-binding MarR family transcriptional regulator [Amnibacterium kyonggiense]
MSTSLEDAVPPRSARGDGATLLYLIKQVELAVRVRLDAVLREDGLTVAQYTALTVLERRPRLTSAQLAKNSFVRAQTMSAVTAELEERGLVFREQDPTHQRRQLLSVTPEGLAALERVLPDVRRIEEQMVSGMSGAQVVGLREALQACRSALGGGLPH